VTVHGEIRDVLDAVNHMPPPHQQTSATERIRQIWLLSVIGLGLLATLAWSALLGWLMYQLLIVLTR